jgi:alanine dehydrogenase
VFAWGVYDKGDYIRDYAEFLELAKTMITVLDFEEAYREIQTEIESAVLGSAFRLVHRRAGCGGLRTGVCGLHRNPALLVVANGLDGLRLALMAVGIGGYMLFLSLRSVTLRRDYYDTDRS